MGRNATGEACHIQGHQEPTCKPPEQPTQRSGVLTFISWGALSGSGDSVIVGMEGYRGKEMDVRTIQEVTPQRLVLGGRRIPAVL